MFTIPASGTGSFLQAIPPATPVKYTIAVAPHDAAKKPLGAASSAVTVMQVKNSSPPIQFGPNAVLPSIELVHYTEKIGQVPLTQIFFATATVALRAVNNGSDTTDPISVSVTDFNVLMRQTGAAAKIGALKKGESSAVITLNLSAVLPPPKSQTPQEQ
jgi:hypothetical protein